MGRAIKWPDGSCPTCGSNQKHMDRSPTANPFYPSWDQWRRAEASFVCPDPWHTDTQESE